MLSRNSWNLRAFPWKRKTGDDIISDKKEEVKEASQPPIDKDGTPSDLNVMEGPPIPEIEQPINESNKVQLQYPTEHLICFKELKAATALFGDEYVLIFKALWYNLLSYPIRRSKLLTGRLKLDGRISPLFIINSGRGKGELKRVQKEFVKLYDDGKWKEPTSLHAEQLVGKSVYIKKEQRHEERRGYLRSDFLIIDEAFNLLSSSELHYSEARKYLRTALDAYPNNTVSKQLVELGEDHALEYEPECPITLFVQPLRFENDILVLEGDIRRFLPVYVYMGDSNKIEALKRRVFDSFDDETSIHSFKDEIYKLDVFESFKMSYDALPRFAELSVLLTERGMSYSPKIANFMEIIMFTLQNNLLKFSAIQAFQNNRSTIKIVDVDLAFMDLFEIMEHTYEFVERKIPGSLDYSDGWQGARSKDQDALRWLQEMGATSEENTMVSIKDYEDKLGEIFNVKERRARTHKNRHESQGWIKTKKAPSISKVWLTFNPEDTHLTEATDEPYQEYLKISRGIQSYTKDTPKAAAPITPIASIASDDELSSPNNENSEVVDYEAMTDEDLHHAAYHGDDSEAMEILDARILKRQMQKEGVD